MQRAVTRSLQRHTKHRAGRGVAALDATVLVPRRRPSFMSSSTPARTRTIDVACRSPSRTPISRVCDGAKLLALQRCLPAPLHPAS